MAKKRHTFVINDESVLNSYGFRVLTAGIQTKQYKKNPLVLWMHKRPNRWEGNEKDKERFPIGTAHNVRTNPENRAEKLADIEFYDKNSFAKTIGEMVEDGIIRMCSIGIEAISLSDEPKYLLTGQSRKTVTKSELFEISVADIGANPNALKLYNNQLEAIELSADGDNDAVPLLSRNTNNSKKSHTMTFEQQVAMLLGLNSDTSPESLYKELSKKLKLADETEGIKVQLSDMKTKYDTLSGLEVTKLVNANIDKKFKADEKDDMIQLGTEMGAEFLSKHMERLPNIDGRPGGKIKLDRDGGDGGGDETEDPKTMDDLYKLGYKAVSDFRKTKPTEFIQLYKEKYKREPDLSDLA